MLQEYIAENKYYVRLAENETQLMVPYMYKFLRHVNFENVTNPVFRYFIFEDHQFEISWISCVFLCIHNIISLVTTSDVQSRNLCLMYQNCPQDIALPDHTRLFRVISASVQNGFNEKCS